MANTVSNISYANTFGEWVVATNGLINENNTLAVGDYTKSTGTIYLNETTKTGLQANGNIVVQTTSGTFQTKSAILIFLDLTHIQSIGTRPTFGASFLTIMGFTIVANLLGFASKGQRTHP